MILAIIYTWLVCNTGTCHTEYMAISPEALAVATCESGDTATFGLLNWDAVNKNDDGTIDSGAWQFNDYWTWSSDEPWAIRPIANSLGYTPREFIAKYPMAKDAPPQVQYATFLHVWDNGYGWEHWASSKPCWSQWITIKKGRAIMK